MNDKRISTFNHDPDVVEPIGKVVHSFVIDGELIFVLKLKDKQNEIQTRTFDPVQLQKEKAQIRLERENKDKIRPITRGELYFILEKLGFEIKQEFIDIIDEELKKE